MGIFEYNGSSIAAMCGKNCVAIASDKRLGIQSFQTVGVNFQRSFKVNDQVYIGLAGLATDIQTFYLELRFRMNRFELKEERVMDAESVAKMVSAMLYGKRFGPYFIEPVVAGLNKSGKPFIASFDSIGACSVADDFVTAGTASEQILGCCEAFYAKDFSENELFETLSQCFLAGVDRDTISGWGATVHIITPSQIISKELKGRMD